MSPGRNDDDPSADDPVERIGRLIGRGLSILIAVLLVLYLWHTYVSR